MTASRRDLPLARSLLSTGTKPLPRLFPTPTAELVTLHDKLYNFLALVLRAHVQDWYSRISPRDQTLLPTINELIAQILPALVQVDAEVIHDLLLTDLPILLTTHIRTYWNARGAVLIDHGALDKAYHARLPLPSVALRSLAVPVEVPTALAEALSEPLSARPRQAQETYALSPAYLTALSDALLFVHLPPADYASDAERFIVREVLAGVVLDNVGKRLSAPWFWAEVCIKHLPPPQSRPKMNTLDVLQRTFALLVSSLCYLWTAGTLLLKELRLSPPPKRTRVVDPWLALLRATIDGPSVVHPTPVFLSLALLVLESACLLLSPVLDRLVPRLLERAVSPRTGTKILDIAERTLFPNGWPTPSVEPTPEEVIELDKAFRKRMRDRGVPEYMVDPVSDAGCNAHLVGLVFDAVAAAVVPELALCE